MSVLARVPGKAILAGEYAVLAGAPAIVAAVARHLECEASPSERLEIEGAGATWREGEPEPPALRFALSAVRVARQYLAGRGTKAPAFRYEISDDLRAPDGQKLGLGGSACTSVAVVAATLAGAGRELERGLVFELAAIAHGAAQQKAGSAIDLAASTWGGVLWTRRFEVGPFLGLIGRSEEAFANLVDLAELPEREALPEPPGLTLVFSGTSASTPALIEIVERFARRDPRTQAEFVARSSEACDRLRRALIVGNAADACSAIAQAGRLLEILGDLAGAPIVTEAHREIAARASAVGASAKISGAGGGDCSVALGAEGPIRRLREELAATGRVVLAPGIDAEGLVVQTR